MGTRPGPEVGEDTSITFESDISFWKSLLPRRCFFGGAQSRLRQLSSSTAAVAARPRRGMPSRCVEKSWMLVAVNIGAKGFEVQ